MCRRASILLRTALIAGVAAVSGCAAPSAGPGVHGQLDTSDRLRLAAAAADSGNRDMAASLYLRALADPHLPIAQRIRAVDMLVALGHTASAEAALTERLHEAPALDADDEAAMQRALARVHLVAGQPSQALAECDALLAHNSGDLAATVDKAVALDLLGRHAEAQGLYRTVLAATPDDAAVRSDLALSVALQGHISEAEAVAAPLQARPDLPDRVKTDLGLLTAAGKNPGNAAPWLDGRTTADADVAMLVDAMRARAGGQAH